MENKVVLSPKKIVSKEFKVDFKGYNADEVHTGSGNGNGCPLHKSYMFFYKQP